MGCGSSYCTFLQLWTRIDFFCQYFGTFQLAETLVGGQRNPFRPILRPICVCDSQTHLPDFLLWRSGRKKNKIKKNKNFRGPRRPLFYFLVLSGTRQKSLWFCVCRVCKGWRLESAASRKVYVCIVINRIFYKWTL